MQLHTVSWKVFLCFFFFFSIVKPYTSEPDLRLKMKYSDLALNGPSAFSCNLPANSDQISPDVSEWLRYSMQLADQSITRDPFVARETYREQMKQELEYLESLKWCTATANTKTEPDADELLIQRTQSACAQFKIEHSDFGRTQTDCQYRVTPPPQFKNHALNDTHVVPEPESLESILDLERGHFNNTPPALVRTNNFTDQLYCNSYLCESQVDKKGSDSELESYSDPDDFVVEYDDFTPSPKIESTWKKQERCHGSPGNYKVLRQKEELVKDTRKGGKATFKSGRPRLCQFLIELLNNPDKYNYMIEWLDKEKGVFKFLNSGEVARMWGTRRNKPHMKYENFARSLRTYIAKGILTKPRSKLVYRFANKKH